MLLRLRGMHQDAQLVVHRDAAMRRLGKVQRGCEVCGADSRAPACPYQAISSTRIFLLSNDEGQEEAPQGHLQCSCMPYQPASSCKCTCTTDVVT